MTRFSQGDRLPVDFPPRSGCVCARERCFVCPARNVFRKRFVTADFLISAQKEDLQVLLFFKVFRLGAVFFSKSYSLVFSFRNVHYKSGFKVPKKVENRPKSAKIPHQSVPTPSGDRLGQLWIFGQKSTKIVRNRPFKMARISIFHYKSGLKVPKRVEKRPKIAKIPHQSVPTLSGGHLGQLSIFSQKSTKIVDFL